ncbi:MAG: amidohydrolase [Firmicutes bacterium]|nr:amidohydrolase [Bacillota bacterium]
MKDMLLREAKALQPMLQDFRREIHKHPETGFDLVHTKAMVKQALEDMGYEPQDCGKAGVVVTVGGKKPGKVFLLRADMDALPLPDETDYEYKSQIPGKMHACGHDMHATMLMGAAKLLKEHEDEIEGTIKLMFQPAEEIFAGAEDMINNGVLENPKPDAAMMIHVAIGSDHKGGTFVVPTPGISMASVDQYVITVKGKGGHGSTPHLAVDPITAAAHIHLALQEINSREINGHDFAVFTTCMVRAGETFNVIPEFAEMSGTIRTLDGSGQIADYIRKRIEEIAKGVGAAMRCDVDVKFPIHGLALVVDEQVSACAETYMTELAGEDYVYMNSVPSNGSEDFALVSHAIPSINVDLVVGSKADGYELYVHNPKSSFDDQYLWKGTAGYAYMAMRWLEEHK